MNNIANQIIAYRESKGLSQEELAEKSSINLRTIKRIENGENNPRNSTLKLLCDALEIDIKDLLLAENEKGSLRSFFNLFFLLVLNLVLMLITGFCVLDSNANLNSLFGGILLSFFIPAFIVHHTKDMKPVERLVKFGSGYIAYFFLVTFASSFSYGWFSGLFICLAISITVLYFGHYINVKKSDQ